MTRRKLPIRFSNCRLPAWLLALATISVAGGAVTAGCAQANHANLDAAVRDGSTPGEDAAPLAGDAIPQGAVTFFAVKQCPKGWSPFSPGEGRSIVPTVADAVPGATSGKPLADGEDRLHHHGYAGTVTPAEVSFVGVVGGGNPLAGAGAVMYSGTTDDASSNLPYVQLLVCQKDALPVAGSRPIAPGTLLFFGSDGCPTGWTQATATQGRFVVGLPDGAKPGLSFGGGALKAAEQRNHGHAYLASFTPPPKGIGLAAGCCGGGYAKSESLMLAGNAADSSVEWPYLQMVQCEKQ